MTKLIQQLNFSSSINKYYDVSDLDYDVSALDFDAGVEKYYRGDGASSLSVSAVGSKRTALSASDAECFSLCLGAGPLCSAPPGGVNSGASSPATPSTPVHDDSNRDLLSALLWASASSLSGSSESLGTDIGPRPELHAEQREAVIRKILERKDRQPVKIDFKIFLTENTMVRWEAVVQGGSMYLRVPSVLQAGSKESFMLLLDFAEERLACNNCIICVLKTRPDRATLLRTFMFMGFQVLPPHSPAMQEINNPDYMFLYYNMQ